MADVRGQSPVAEEPAELVGHHHGAMVSARAPDRHAEVGLPLVDVPGNHHVEQALETIHEGSVLLLALNVRPDAFVGPGQRPQRLDPVGVGQEPMMRSASPRRLSIISRSLRMPSTTRSAGASGCRRRVAS